MEVWQLGWRAGLADKTRVINGRYTEFRSCVKVEVEVLGSPSLIVLMASVEVKQNLNLNGIIIDTWSVVI